VQNWGGGKNPPVQSQGGGEDLPGLGARRWPLWPAGCGRDRPRRGQWEWPGRLLGDGQLVGSGQLVGGGFLQETCGFLVSCVILIVGGIFWCG
jgi:hypothetical protein